MSVLLKRNINDVINVNFKNYIEINEKLFKNRTLFAGVYIGPGNLLKNSA